jgi:hypothetical protein
MNAKTRNHKLIGWQVIQGTWKSNKVRNQDHNYGCPASLGPSEYIYLLESKEF